VERWENLKLKVMMIIGFEKTTADLGQSLLKSVKCQSNSVTVTCNMLQN
jgi:hypothetical protein